MRVNLSVLCTHARRLLLYYYIFFSSRAATILGGRLVACGRLSIGQMSLTSSTPRLRLFAMRGRVRATAKRRGAHPPQDAILPHVRRAIPLACRTPVRSTAVLL